jgi:hypothetical protein
MLRFIPERRVRGCNAVATRCIVAANAILAILAFELVA